MCCCIDSNARALHANQHTCMETRTRTCTGCFHRGRSGTAPTPSAVLPGVCLIGSSQLTKYVGPFRGDSRVAGP
jgi:hypothetical protein